MWLLILAGLLTVSVGEETISHAVEKAKPSSDSASDIVMLEIDVKEPVKRSPIQATADYGAPSNQYILQPADGTQELPPEYLSALQQYAQEAPQPQVPPPQRRVQPEYAKQQQALQQTYYNFRKPTVVPPRPRAQLHPQASAQADQVADIQAQVDAQSRAEAIRIARLGSNAPSSSSYQSSYSQPKLGTFEQELLQLVSANQAQEFKLLPTQPKGSASPYSQQLISYPTQYAKQPVEPAQLPEQYHIETSPPQYQQQQQQPLVAYQSVEEPAQYQPVQPAKAYNQAEQGYGYLEDESYLKALEQAQAHAQAQAQAQLQAQTEAQALAFQNVAQNSYRVHQQNALEHIEATNERYRQQSALEQIQQGGQVSDAGRVHLEEQVQPKTADAAYRAKLKAQERAETAEARKLQQAVEFKAHADAIRNLEAQQQAHVKVQEQAAHFAANFDKIQMRAQALAQAQAEALYKASQQNRKLINNEILAISKGERKGKKLGHVQVFNLPTFNNHLPNDQYQKYEAAGSSHVPRSVPKPDNLQPVVETAQAQPIITQPRQTHKLKIPSPPQSVYVSESGLLKKSPIKSITIEEVTVEPDQIANHPLLQTATPKGRTLTEEDLSALINAGYTVTPVVQTAKSSQQVYATDNGSAGYYTKKQKAPVARAEYVTYEEVIQRPRKLIRKNRPILKHDEKEDASEKVTYLVPLEPAFGTRQPALNHEE